ncbi:hypothetical protein CNMCM8980_004040 [Aspergillus fumigatiaffinis]|nr:hypothetical protein CNMCM8980_004040 [Aspergillus fumigatiaffinis]
MSELYIPPDGIYFRLYNDTSKRVLYSRKSGKPEFGHHTVDEEHEDQYFSLVKVLVLGVTIGYRIKSKVTGKYIFARGSGNPLAGHSADKYSDQIFRFEPGTGARAGYFRLRSRADRVLVSRTSPKSEVTSAPVTSTYPDQYFTFLFEDMKIDRVEYHIEDGEIIDEGAVTIGKQTLDNYSSVEQSSTFTFAEEMSVSSTFERTHGFSITVETEFKTGIPIVAEGKIKVSVTTTHEFKWGETKTYSQKYEGCYGVCAPPRKRVVGICTMKKSRVNVPFTVYLKSVETGKVVTTEGSYDGITLWDMHFETKEEDLPETNLAETDLPEEDLQ